MLLAATFAFFRLSGVSADTTNFQIAGRLESWLVKDYYATGEKCEPERLFTSEYYKLSGVCFDGVEMSCLTDPTGTVNGILTVTTMYNDYSNSECHGSVNNIEWQDADLFDEWPTYCRDDGDESYRYRCINLPRDQLPFKVDEANTLVTVGFQDDNCVMDLDNVLAAKVRQINKCESSQSSFNSYSAKSRKISDCGFLWEYFSDYECRDRVSFSSSTYANDFECEDISYIRRLEYVSNVFGNVDYDLAPESELSFCAGGNYGDYANKNYQKKKADVDVSVSGEVPFAQEVVLAIKQRLEQQASAKLVLASSVSEGSASQQVITPMNYAYLGSVAFIGIVLGAVVSAKFFKSQNQFEGVEMQSAHSNI